MGAGLVTSPVIELGSDRAGKLGLDALVLTVHVEVVLSPL